jgi:polyhydroxyalkanoate synthase
MNERSAAPNAGGLDRPLHAAMARATSGIAPAAVNLAYADWLQQYLLSPDKQIELFAQSMRNRQTLFALGAQAALGPAAPAVVEPAAQDKRFADPAWRSRPFNAAGDDGPTRHRSTSRRRRVGRAMSANVTS